jgi:N-acetylmuramoyl-L-alanine amidase
VRVLLIALAAAAAAPHATLPPPRPQITQARIPMPPARLAQLRAYNRRHYGVATARLRRPKLIVEHYTVSTTLSSPIAYWSAWRSPVEGEFPKTCAHFIVDKDGRIYQTVSLRLTCRQALGVGYTSIGIEHVGMSDAEVISDVAQMRASVRLTRWLQHRYRIPTRRVIGHAEVRASPFFRDRAPGGSAHVDMQPWVMQRYRAWLDGGD